MALMLGKLYDALRAGGTPDDKALAAAEEVAGFDREIGAVRTEVHVVQGIGGVIIVVLFAVLWQLFAMRGEMAELRAGFASLREEQSRLRAEMQSGFAAIERRLPAAPP